MNRAPWALHPVLLATAFVVQAAFHNGLPPTAFVRPALVAAGAALAVTALLRLVLRDTHLAGLFSTGLLLVLISHDPVIVFLTTLADAWGDAGTLVGVALVLFVLITALVVGLDRRRRGDAGRVARRATSALNVFGAALLVVVLVPALPSIPSWMHGPSAVRRAVATDERPRDVYLFLLDGYSRADELDRQFGIDNEPFLAALHEQGFDVGDASHSNYTYTALTLTALLTMDYLSTPASGPLAEGDLAAQLHDAMLHGAGTRALRDAGYEIVAFAAGWEGTSLRAAADRYFDRPELTDFEQTLLARTWIPDLAPVSRTLFFDHLRSRIDGVLDDAASLAEAPADAPTFAFVHVPAPHLPIAFTADGGPTPYDSRRYLAGKPSEFGLSDDEFAAAYGDSLAYLNRRVLETIDTLQDADEPPVIILMSDHGFNGDSPVHEAHLLRNLFAAYTPDHPGALAAPPTPVNVLRGVLDQYGTVDTGPWREDRFFTTVLSGEVGRYRIELTEVTDP